MYAGPWDPTLSVSVALVPLVLLVLFHLFP
jgi:hypothetical protein